MGSFHQVIASSAIWLPLLALCLAGIPGGCAQASGEKTVNSSISSISLIDVGGGGSSSSSSSPLSYSDCHKDLIPFDESRGHKRKFRVAVHAVRGLEEDLASYNETFATYLTATAGRRFDPPIEFELVAVGYEELFSAVEKVEEYHSVASGQYDEKQDKQVDFIFANPSSYSCIGVEYGVTPLVTKISHTVVRGQSYSLDVLGGVIFARADNDAIHSIYDLKDKIIAASSLSVLMGGQTQMYEMVLAGLDYVMDPKQVIFTENKVDVVNGVLNGDFDVGFVRTDQIERTEDANGNLINPNLFRILEPRVHVLDDGSLFPFLHSTDIYGEWPVAAMTFVPDDVAEEVQAALLALDQHAKPYKSMLQCMEDIEVMELEEARTGTFANTDSDLACDAIFFRDQTRCDTTPDIARIAYQAGENGHIDGFRAPRSYFEVRSMQEAGGFMKKNEETNTWACSHSTNLYDSITCPPEHYKLSPREFEESCHEAGLPCPEGYNCYCKPCLKAFDVAVFQYDPLDDSTLNHTGCDKMDLCGTMEQKEEVYFMVVDNKRRENPEVTALIHLGHDSHDIAVEELSDHRYQIHWDENKVGEGIVEISFDGEQIPESPFRIHILPRSCDASGGRRVPDEDGYCICDDGTTEIAGNCVTGTVLAVVCSLGGLAVACILGYLYIQHKNRLNDMVWHVNPDELQFDDPMEVIGEGAFGVVLLAEYRGTKVAIKRAINKAGGFSRSADRGSLLIAAKSNQFDEEDNSQITRNSTALANVSFASDGDEDSNSGDLEAAQTAASINDSGMFENRGRGSTSRGSGSAFGRRKKSSNAFDLAFLADRFGDGRKKVGLGWFSEGKNRTNDKFEIAVGRSSAGTRSTSFSRTIAAKLCPGMNEEKRRKEEFIAEMRLLSTLRHPCICTIMGAVMATAHGPMIVMEYMEYGSLNDLLRNETMYLTGEIILQIARDVAQGLRYLHSAKPAILHGDMKPANILVDGRFRAKVCDFGLSRKKKNAISGSLFWLPPEYLVGNDDYSPASDMYSMGIILNEVYSRKKPYAGEELSLRQLLSDICDRRVNKRPSMSPTMPPKMADLVKSLWNRDPTLRPPSRQLDMLLADFNISDVEPLTQAEMDAKPRTEDMLYDIFPRHIAEALKAGKKVEPETHDMVTIVFSDIKGFTDISREISPMKVSMMLDRLYLAIDAIARKHKVFKVETIGDAWMGVTNLVEDQEDCHVKSIAEFAIDMINAASMILIDEDEPNKGYVQIRVGFHSGPVVSNVIGSLNPRYGLFGDTVNTASRMESNSFGSRILCSASSFQILKKQAPEMPCKRRGKISVKGKGDMTVYWIGDELIARNKKERRKTIAMSPEDTSLLEDHSIQDIMREDSTGVGLEDLSPDLDATRDVEAQNEKKEYPEDTKTSGSSQTDDESSEDGFEDEPQPQKEEQTRDKMSCHDLGDVVASGTQGRQVGVSNSQDF